jgi:hypothetical protein
MVPLCHVTWLQHPILFGQQPSYLLHCTFPSLIFIDSIVYFNLSFLQVFRCLLGLGSFYSLKRVLAYKRAFLPITFNGIRFIPKTTITLITYLGSWAFVASIIAVRFMVNQHPCLFEALTRVDNFPFQQHFKVACDLLPFQVRTCLPPFEQLIGQQIPFRNVCTIMSFLTCFLTGYLK